MQATRAEPRLSDHERGPLIPDAVALWHAHVLEQDLAMAARIVETEHLELPHDGHAGCVHRHQHHGVPRMPFRVRIGHTDEQDHPRVADAPPRW